MSGIFIFLCKSCLKSGSTTSYYEVLGLDSRCDTEAVKKSYKKLSLALHPDKIAQRGAVVTEDDKTQLLRVKEAYAVLVDPKRRKLYDQLGDMGLKLVEDPSAAMRPDMQAKIIQNFQHNSKDRYKLFLIIMLFYCCIAIFPILFAAKCDGYIPRVTWAALWTPLWAANLFLISGAILAFIIREHTEEDEDGNVASTPRSWQEWAAATLNLALTATWILTQLFLVLRLDRIVLWSWYSVFAPWFAYDAVKAAAHFYSGCVSTVPRPDFAALKKRETEEDGSDPDGPDENVFQAEMEYYQKLMEQEQDKGSFVLSCCRIWLAGFLAYKLNIITDTNQMGSDSWNWGLVMLPIWVWIFYLYVEAVRAYFKGIALAAAIAAEASDEPSPSDMVKMQYAQGLSSACFASCFCSIPAVVLMSVLLVCSLEIKPISTYIIILPAFISLFVLLMCVCGVWCCLATVDADGLEKAATEGGAYMPPGSGGDTEGTGSGAGAESNEGEAVVVITPIEAEAAPVIAPVSAPAPAPAPVAALESVAPASPTDVGLDELASTEVPESTETNPSPARAPAPVSVSLNAEELD